VFVCGLFSENQKEMSLSVK